MNHPLKEIRLRLCFIAVILTLASGLLAQVEIIGDVVDANSKEPLIGASVLIKGSNEGNTTDVDGRFKIRTSEELPVTLVISYLGYETREHVVSSSDSRHIIELSEKAVNIDVVEVRAQRLSERARTSALTVESLDVLAIKETPAANFYDGLGSLKGVDLTTASLGFTVINTRGFNSTSPVRSLQVIDGVDNQSPGLNFSLGNFLGAPELDVLKVELVQGASSAFYGPNAFNGCIDMQTKDPFYTEGLSAMVKLGERSLVETAIRYADVFQNSEGEDKFAFKINLSYLSAMDWVADNMEPTIQSTVGKDNPGGYDAVNVYGDENVGLSVQRDFTGDFERIDLPGLGVLHRTGYREQDLVDYDTRNFKGNIGLHYRLTDEVELIAGGNVGSGSTVYQGENRFRLENILFYQTKLELRKKGKFFLRGYLTKEDAGDSFDIYATGQFMVQEAKDQFRWTADYRSFWQSEAAPVIRELEGYPDVNSRPYDYDQQSEVLEMNAELIRMFHERARQVADSSSGSLSDDRYLPGTPEFERVFDRITSNLFNDPDAPGTRFYDKSALYHIHGEYIFKPKFGDIVVGGNFRQYNPDSRGTIFIDTFGREIINREFGLYAGINVALVENRLKVNLTSRLDKNENFDFVVSPAASVIYTPNSDHLLRFSMSSALRNPTLADQYLNLNVGRAQLRGNITGFENLATLESFIDYLNTRDRDTITRIDVAPIQPERVITLEMGYRGTITSQLYIDAGYYFNFYRKFIGYKLGVDLEINPFTNFPTRTRIMRVSANSKELVTSQGFAIGLNYYFDNQIAFSGNYSWNVLNTESNDDIIPAFNTPEHKFNLGFNGRSMTLPLVSSSPKNFGFNINYKWIEGFLFEGSPQFTGEIDTYDLLDVQVNWKFRNLNTTLKIGASNVLNKLQYQTYGGPRIGRMAYISLLYESK
ncbi:MAG: TonB-dependent receptor [Saprospiraceae bacterium]|nr:TonB-dependent receptor [Saprospiraceae bacterium]